MVRIRDLLQDLLWAIFTKSLAWMHSCGRHWRRIVTFTTMGVAIVRGVIWVAKAIASAGTVDTALNLIGLGEYVRPFEDGVDSIISSIVTVVLTVTPTN